MAPTESRLPILPPGTVRNTIERSFPLRRVVPSVVHFIAIGLAVFARAASLELAEELFRDGDYAAAAREAHRALPQLSGHARDHALLLMARARLRIECRSSLREEALRGLQHLANTAQSPQLRGRAALEAGYEWLRRGQPEVAWAWLAAAFRAGAENSVSLAAGAELLWLGRQNPRRWRRDPDLELAVATLRQALWDLPLVAREQQASSWFARMGLGVVHGYRRQIRPAIGSRCQLHPTCSEYFSQAVRRHGLMALPLIADRLVREPSVVRAAEQVIVESERIAYADPLEAHTFWWRKDR